MVTLTSLLYIPQVAIQSSRYRFLDSFLIPALGPLSTSVSHASLILSPTPDVSIDLKPEPRSMFQSPGTACIGSQC